MLQKVLVLEKITEAGNKEGIQIETTVKTVHLVVDFKFVGRGGGRGGMQAPKYVFFFSLLLFLEEVWSWGISVVGYGRRRGRTQELNCMFLFVVVIY